MTKTELNKIIAKSINYEWFKSQSADFNFHYVQFEKHFDSVSAVFEYVKIQSNGWNKFGNSLPNQFIEAKNYFVRIEDSITQLIQNYVDSDVNMLNRQWQQIQSLINNVNSKPINYDSTLTSFLIDLFIKQPSYFEGAYNFLFGISYDTRTKESFIGAVIAYEFTVKDITEITGRKEHERKSINKLKSDFIEYIKKSEEAYLNNINEAESLFTKYSESIDELRNTKESDFNEWFEKTKKDDWQKWFDEKNDALKKLEETYETKLKLEKPAKYWSKKSSNYYIQGNKAKVLLFWIVGISCTLLTLILIISPDWIFNTVFEGNKLAVVRWSIVFITLLSLIAFAVRALTKYMFSSFHLARDAEERHTLTFFYLALLKDTDVKDEDRKLILQSLFSRVETGLLKDDSSPTMPSDTISKFMKQN
jgi:hypothetical protein